MDGDDSALREIEGFFHDKIPLTRAMGVTVAAWDGRQLELRAPLEANHNHLGTAFGGSLSAIATLAGYGLLWLELGDREAHVVVKRGEIDYLRPVRGEIRVICRRPDAERLAVFKDRFLRAGKAGIRLEATIDEGGRTSVVFAGTFVAMK